MRLHRLLLVESLWRSLLDLVERHVQLMRLHRCLQVEWEVAGRCKYGK